MSKLTKGGQDPCDDSDAGQRSVLVFFAINARQREHGRAVSLPAEATETASFCSRRATRQKQQLDPLKSVFLQRGARLSWSSVGSARRVRENAKCVAGRRDAVNLEHVGCGRLMQASRSVLALAR